MSIYRGMRSLYGRFPLFIFVVIILLPSCHVHPGAKVPRWLSQQLFPPGEMYAVGWCEKTLFRKDAEKCAVERAITEMAITLSAAVFSAQLMRASEKNASLQSKEEIFIPVDLLKSLAEAAETVDVWYDEKGIAGPPEITYALVKFKKEKVRPSGFIPVQQFPEKVTGKIIKCSGSAFPVHPEEVLRAEGVCERTLYLYSGFMCARKRALADLAKIIALKIENKMFDFQGKISQNVSTSSIITGAALTGSRVTKVFRDTSGNTHVIVEITGKDLIKSLRDTGGFLASLGISPYKEIGMCIISILNKVK